MKRLSVPRRLLLLAKGPPHLKQEPSAFPPELGAESRLATGWLETFSQGDCFWVRVRRAHIVIPTPPESSTGIRLCR